MVNTVDENKRNLVGREHATKLKDFIKEFLDKEKGEDIIEIDLEGKTDFAYYFIVASGRSAKHVSSLAEKLSDEIIKFGVKDVSIEGKNNGEWVLIDAHDVIVHLFRPETRNLYQLEKIWEF